MYCACSALAVKTGNGPGTGAVACSALAVVTVGALHLLVTGRRDMRASTRSLALREYAI